MSLRCWTPGTAMDTVLTTWLVLVARHGHTDAEGNQQLWEMHPAGRQSYQSPMWPVIVTTPLQLLHIDFTSIETMRELDQPSNMVNLLLFCDHFMKDIMAYVASNQTVKTIATFLWQGYILIFSALAKLLSDWEAKFVSKTIRELCKLLGIWKIRTSPYHAQTNERVEWAHQILINMIGKLSKEWKADWPKLLPKLVHAYNSTRSAITGHSLHYLMFGCQMYLPVNFYFTMISGTKTPACWPLHCRAIWMTVGSLWRGLSTGHIRGGETEVVLWSES